MCILDRILSRHEHEDQLTIVLYCARNATYFGLDGSLLVLQDVSNVDDFALICSTRGPPDYCALLCAIHATYSGPYGSHVVLQGVSVTDAFCHGLCQED
jgi:hypothetical protein